MIRRPPRSTLSSSSAASDVYKRQVGWWRPILHGGFDPGDLDAPEVSEPLGLRQADRREVHTGHLPTLFRQPDRVATLATREIHRPACRKPDDLSHEELIGPAGRHPLVPAVALVPLLAIHLHALC